MVCCRRAPSQRLYTFLQIVVILSFPGCSPGLGRTSRPALGHARSWYTGTLAPWACTPSPDPFPACRGEGESTSWRCWRAAEPLANTSHLPGSPPPTAVGAGLGVGAVRLSRNLTVCASQAVCPWTPRTGGASNRSAEPAAKPWPGYIHHNHLPRFDPFVNGCYSTHNYQVVGQGADLPHCQLRRGMCRQGGFGCHRSITCSVEACPEHRNYAVMASTSCPDAACASTETMLSSRVPQGSQNLVRSRETCAVIASTACPGEACASTETA